MGRAVRPVGLAGNPFLSRIRTTLLPNGEKITRTRNVFQFFFLAKKSSKKENYSTIELESVSLLKTFPGKPNCHDTIKEISVAEQI